jgi:sugar lactone lactonase YvrE
MAPESLALDATGNVYVADYSNRRIQKFTCDGKFVNSWTIASGELEYLFPEGVAVDSSNNIYVICEGFFFGISRDCVQKFAPDGKLIARWGAGGKAKGRFDEPKGIAVDGSGNVYVADHYNNRVQKFPPEKTSEGKQTKRGPE